MEVLPFSKNVEKTIVKYRLSKKLCKQLKLLVENLKHPSLNVELLEPKRYAIYSFRIDIKFRALFVFHKEFKGIEILSITKHYR
ncbi:MAG: hypothetical protein ABIB98_02565 [bacterium]